MKLRYFLLILISGLASAGFASAAKDSETLTVAFPRSWKLPLHPATQHSAGEDAIMANEFEPLVIRGSNGLVVPQAAKSFEFNKDFTIFTFKIDTTHRFSDGTPLTAQHFKDSWENGLLKNPNSANSNQLDVISLLKGFEDFEKTKHIDGIRVLSNEVLELTFNKPFRMALHYLSGARFSAYIDKNGKTIGSNRYVVTSASPTEITFAKNPYYPSNEGGFEKIVLSYYDQAEESLEALKNKKVDIIAFNGQKIEETGEIGTTTSHESKAFWIDLNGLQGRFFASIEMRQAFQALVWDLLRNEKNLQEKMKTAHASIDPQVYLKLQAGRIPDAEAEAIVEKGLAYIPKLIEESKKANLKFLVDGVFSFLEEGLRQKGLKFESVTMDFQQALQDYYKNFTVDARFSAASVHNSDPDGLYHRVGRNGAITSPMIQREKVAQLMEEGRNLVGQEAIAVHYQKVTRAMLEEIPSIHVGFGYQNFAYRKTRIKVSKRFTESHSEFLYIFEPLSWYEKLLSKF